MGFITAILPCALLQILFGDMKIWKFKNPYINGILFAVFIWLIAGGVINADLRYDIIGVMKKDTGPTLLELYRHSHYGFLASGLLVSMIASLLRKVKKD